MGSLYHQSDLNRIYLGDALATLQELPSCSVHCCVVSPPYWALRDYGVDGQLGSERTPEEYIANMVAVFREVRRVLRDDGTLWLNIGDSYAGSGRGGYAGGKSGLQGSTEGQDQSRVARISNEAKHAGFHQTQVESGAIGRLWVPPPDGMKQKDMVGVPWMLAFALRSDGWYLRSEIIWSKKSPMPESVRDRPCKSHEHIFLLTKSSKYFYDLIGSQEDCTGNAHARGRGVNIKAKPNGQIKCKQNDSFSSAVRDIQEKRNMRTVWSIGPFPLKQAHFAAFPPELVRRCLVAGVSEFGCCNQCGKPYERITKRDRVATRPGTNSKINFPANWQSGEGSHKATEHNRIENHPKTKHDLSAEQNGFRPSQYGNRDPQRHVTRIETVGSRPGCDCLDSLPVPSTVLDPFHGAGTTMKVCERLSLRYVGIELNQSYIDLSLERPDVHFPHEKRKSVKRKKVTLDQLELF